MRTMGLILYPVLEMHVAKILGRMKLGIAEVN